MKRAAYLQQPSASKAASKAYSNIDSRIKAGSSHYVHQVIYNQGGYVVINNNKETSSSP
jgi:hypothetical protein